MRKCNIILPRPKVFMLIEKTVCFSHLKEGEWIRKSTGKLLKNYSPEITKHHNKKRVIEVYPLSILRAKKMCKRWGG